MPALRPIAAAQTIPIRGDVSANVAEHVRLIELATAHQVQRLVFPELSLTGYELDLASGLAFSEPDSRLQPLRELAFARRNVVFSNYGGPSGGLASAGQSAISSAQGKFLASLEASGSGIAVATI